MVPVPEPILVSIAAALAAKTTTSLYELVKGKFAGREEAKAALEAADGASPDSPEVAALAAQLDTEETEDPEFGEELRRTWQQTTASHGGVVNQITGNVSGKVVQARDITGDIKF
jgi:hypothetical protein